jgi:hypothetical protein
MSHEKLDPAKILDGMLEMDGRIAPYYSYFHDYTPTNMAYLWMQGAREIVGKRRDWESVGREVQPGAQRYAIWVPWFKKIPDPHEPDAEPVEVLGGFNTVPCLYTLHQTTGEPIQPRPTPGFSTVQALGKLGIRHVEFASQYGNLQGYSHGTEVAVSPIAANPLKTYLHEMAHVILGHTLPHQYEEYRTHRGIMEFQAEGVAYVVLNLLGVMDEDTAAHSRGYIRHWLRDEQPPEQAVRQVLTVSDRILKAGKLAVEGAQ